MFRKALPNIIRQCHRAAQPGYSRHFSGRGRLIPIWRRRSLWDDCFNSPFRPSRFMEDQMKIMQRFMDEMAPPFYYVRNAVKDMQVTYNENVFELKLDVSEYSPEELDVKISGDRLTVSGKHGEKEDKHGIVTREFTRQFSVPEDVEMSSIESLITNDGYLVVCGKVKGSENIPERTIKIEREPTKPEGETK